MALFKILRGDSSRISTDVTPFHDGYAYFTPDDGGFYIDTETDKGQERIRINPPVYAVAVDAILYSNAWNNGKQTIAVNGLTEGTNGTIGISQDITPEQMDAAHNAMLYACGQGKNTLTIAVYGETPTCDIPVTVILFK